MNEAEILAPQLENVLDFLTQDAVVLRPIDRSRRDRVPLTHFDHAEVFLDDTLAFGDRHDIVYFADVRPHDLSRRLDVTLLSPPAPEEAASTLFVVQRYRQVPLSAVRGWRVHSPFVVEHAIAFVHPDGRVETNRGWLEWLGGQRWQRLVGDPGPFRQRDSLNAQLALGLQFTRQYQWFVGFRRPGALEIQLPTDPTGVRALFRLRDVPDDRSRRAALRHWVSAHWRRRRVSDDDLVYVRRHLRGATTFTWLGLHCTIYPSEDAERHNGQEESR